MGLSNVMPLDCVCIVNIDIILHYRQFFSCAIKSLCVPQSSVCRQKGLSIYLNSNQLDPFCIQADVLFAGRWHLHRSYIIDYHYVENGNCLSPR